ncbi:hypothetical protein LPJ73_002534 [Coemansia sp. RSA 2703]|nr:hypothetical protein LPJ73_002534 [Coemansia sp. RSA 2703]KAJ2382141.1 hypothetical protein GGI05_005751 [Coemansia sp. RSA 2603]
MDYGNYGNQGYDNNQYQQGYNYNQNQGQDNNNYQYQQPRGGEADDFDNNRGFVDNVQNYFTDNDGSVDKSHVALAGGGALALGFASKKLYEHFTKDENGRPQEPQFYDAYGQPIQQMKDYNGQLIEQPMYYSDGNPVEPTVVEKLRNFYRDDDGSLDKSNIFWTVVGTAGAGFASKKLYEHFTKDEEGRPQDPKFYDANGNRIYQLKDDNGQLIEQPLYYADGKPVEPTIMDKLRNFYRDDDGSLDKSNIFWALAGTAAAGYAGKKIYEHFTKDEEGRPQEPKFYDANGQPIQQMKDDNGNLIEQPMFYADGTRVESSVLDKVRKFYRDDDGSVDKSNVFWTLAGTAAAGIIGKKVYDHYNRSEGEEGRSRGLEEYDYSNNNEYQEGRSRGFGEDSY